MLKNHTCGELTVKNIGEKVTLAGWVHRRRDHGNLIFIDLRDREGLTQVVFDPEKSPVSHKEAGELRTEYVVKVEGIVGKRPTGTENSNLPTGEIEIIASDLSILNTSKVPPFYINKEVEVDESLRLKYRYLDLRRERMKNNIILRYQVTKFMRDFLDAKGFIEIETPILLKSTPEGARDYLVPSRLYAGQFYALPQSPQQLKQLLMVAGYEKYFQIARCFRDEDSRADRQPEFTQLDIEMSFIDEEDILRLTEDLFTSLIEKIKPEIRMIKPFPRLKFAEVIEKYGNDKPDLRFGMEMSDFTELFANSEFAIFRSAVADGGIIKGICAPGCASYSRKQIEDLTDLVRTLGAKGLVTLAISDQPGEGSDIKSRVYKYLTSNQVTEMKKRLNAKNGDMALIVAGPAKIVNSSLSALRMEMARQLKLIDSNLFAFAFVLDFPLFEWNSDLKKWDFTHHPFTAPKAEDAAFLETDPGRVRAKHYDFVCNGYELSSGSIRIHNSELQKKIFQMLGYSDDDIQHMFGHMIEALSYGAPPHGGIAPGIDRFVMLLAGENTIREVIAFPKTQEARDPMTDCPSPVSEAQLKDLHLKIVEDNK
ncbi:MAG: aspartate--tRNA ligase [Chloroflexi bacterium]|nr:aspartate--tRNA ligase [Chloroflexota bacterium]